MEQHPIPQDVTGFQFKLIGTMTVKQFGYVAVGAILAVVSWYTPVQGFLWQIVTKGLFVPVFGLSGVIIAFVPIEGRPVDVMTANFFRALFSPNQYIYIRKGRRLSFTQIAYQKAPVSVVKTEQKSTNDIIIESKKKRQLRALLASSYKNPKSSLDQKELVFLQSITSLPIQAPTIAPSPAPANAKPFPAHLPVRQSPALSLPNRLADKNPAFKYQQLPQKQNPPYVSTTMPLPVNALTPPAIMPAPVQNISPARNIPQSMTKNAGFYHLPDVPNVIIGIVRDSRGNMLPNILVDIKDKDGNPIRAFKTNPLGQFASATPMPNGSYTIELEDLKKQHAFNSVQINADGQILLPIEIISHDAREQLRKDLFN